LRTFRVTEGTARGGEPTEAAMNELSNPDHAIVAQRGRLVAGLVLMAVGAIFLLGRLDVLPEHPLSLYWPVILVVMGIGKLIAGIGRGFGSGVWLVFVGLWAQANLLHWFGLDWHNSWPLFLIFVGVCVLGSELLRNRGARDAR
jgi:hypothetical protein